MAKTELFLDGINQLIKEMTQFRITVMGSEEVSLNFHRFQLVGRVLSERGFDLAFIRGDGNIQKNEDIKISETLNDIENEGPLLFNEKEKSDRISIDPVLEINIED